MFPFPKFIKRNCLKFEEKKSYFLGTIGSFRLSDVIDKAALITQPKI